MSRVGQGAGEESLARIWHRREVPAGESCLSLKQTAQEFTTIVRIHTATAICLSSTWDLCSHVKAKSQVATQA